MVQEGISIHEMAVSAIIACIFIGVFVSIFNYNHDIQSLIENEQTQQHLNQEYAKVVAYDETDLNGQDILSFLTRYKGSLPVIFADNDGDHAPVYVITNNVVELNTLISGAAGAGSSEWPYTIYKYDKLGTSSTPGSPDLIKTFKANQVYGTNPSQVLLYSAGSPVETHTPGVTLTAQQVINEFSEFIKSYRHDKLGGDADGLYGTWHSVVYYKDVSCREPECIKVWPVG